MHSVEGWKDYHRRSWMSLQPIRKPIWMARTNRGCAKKRNGWVRAQVSRADAARFGGQK
jgi:hypothetical protein